MGRAYPYITMATFFMKKIKNPPFPMILSNEKNEIIVANEEGY